MKYQLLAIAILCTTAVAAQNTGIGTIAPTDQLHTTGTVRFQGYSGLGNRLLYIDSAGRLALPTNGGYYSNATPAAIPDNGCNTNSGATSTINITGFGSAVNMANVSVRLDITHTYDGDLIIFLIAPNGAVLCLSNGSGSSGHNFSGTIFEDNATAFTATGSAPFSGRYKPVASLVSACAITATVTSFGAIGGGSLNPNGAWTLKVFDAASQDIGTLNNWQITFNGSNGFGTGGATGPVAYFNGGNLELSNISQGSNGMIGINNNAPLYNLDVAGNQRITSTLTVGSSINANSVTTTSSVNAGSLGVTGSTNLSGTLQVQGGSPAAGKVLTATAATGTSTWQLPASANTGFSALIPSNTAVTFGSATTLPFNSAVNVYGFDDGPAFNNISHAYVVPASGVYQFNISVGLVSGTAPGNGYLTATLFRNGFSYNYPSVFLTTVAGQALPQGASGSLLVKLVAGDVITVSVYNNAGSTLTISGSPNTQFSGVRILIGRRACLW